MSRTARHLLLGCIATCAASAAGCAGKPSITVTGMDRVASGPRSDEFAIRIRMDNPTADSLVLDRWNYQVETDTGRYSGEWVASRTVPPGSVTDLSVPAVIAHDGAATPTRYSVNGSIRYLLPGQLAETLFDIGLSRPEASFSGSGAVTMSATAPAPTAAPLPGTDRADAPGTAPAGAPGAGGSPSATGGAAPAGAAPGASTSP